MSEPDEITPEMLLEAYGVLEDHYMGDGVYDLSEPVLRQVLRAALSRLDPGRLRELVKGKTI